MSISFSPSSPFIMYGISVSLCIGQVRNFYTFHFHSILERKSDKSMASFFPSFCFVIVAICHNSNRIEVPCLVFLDIGSARPHYLTNIIESEDFISYFYTHSILSHKPLKIDFQRHFPIKYPFLICMYICIYDHKTNIYRPRT